MDYSIQNDLNLIVAAVKQRVSLHRLFLFGSFANGQAGPDSDLDICIVAETDTSKIEALREIRTALFCKAEHPLDFVFFTPTEFAHRAQVPNSFEWQIEHKGQVLYG